MLTIGWREWIGLPDFALARIRAKIDTGARTSALHVETQWRTTQAGAPWVGFRLRPHRRSKRTIDVIAPVCDERIVTDSGGKRSLRVFVRTNIAIAGRMRTIDINLTNRHGMLFPLLIGRSALADAFIVDPARSFLHGRRPTFPQDFDPHL